MVSPADRLVLVTKFSRVDASTSTRDQRSRLLWKPLTSPVGRVMLVTRPSLLYLGEQLQMQCMPIMYATSTTVEDAFRQIKAIGMYLPAYTFAFFSYYPPVNVSTMIHKCNYPAVKDTQRWQITQTDFLHVCCANCEIVNVCH